MLIGIERADDIPAVRAVNLTAFDTPDLVDALRARRSGDFAALRIRRA
jgi:predicted N-acetyltransferase YhbS